jgi:integrase
MTLIRVRGINRVTAKGRLYYYHRASGKRIQADPNDAAAFAAEVAALNANEPIDGPKTQPGTLGGLIAAYRSAAAFLELAPDTRKGYQRAFDACKAIDSMPLPNIDQVFILGLQERIYKKRGRWLANMVVSVLSLVLSWGVPRGIAKSNAAAGVPKIRRPRGTPVANRAWTEREVDAALKAATGGLRKAIALAYYAGLRKKDVVELLLSSRSRGMIATTQSKTGHELSVFEARRLKALLDAKDDKPGETIVVNSLGKPYTRDGLDSVFERLKRDLVKAKAIRPGLTSHGLRKSLGKRAADAGFSELDIAAALGHSSPASSRPYTIEAARKSGARRVIRALDKRRT